MVGNILSRICKIVTDVSTRFSSFLVKHNGNITWTDIITISKAMRPRSMAKTLKGTVKEVLGTAQSVGCTIDGSLPHDLIDAVNAGEIDVPEN